MYNNSFVSYFDMDGYIDDIKQSYQNDVNKMYLQFGKDYSRHNIKLNGCSYTDQNDWLHQLGLLCSNSLGKKLYDLDLKSLVVLLCCQSSFFLSYKLLMEIYEIDSQSFALVCNSRDFDGILINIIVDNDKILIELKNTLLIRNIDMDINTNKISSNITIELDKHITNNLIPNICVFSWNILPIHQK
jgi:hypothetical protein